MKFVQIVLVVPDDFDPDKDIEGITFSEDCDVDSVEILKQEEVSEKLLSSQEVLQAMLDEKVKMLKDQVDDHSIVRIMINPEVPAVDPSILQRTMQVVEETYKCPCICLVDDMNLFVENADEAIKMLNGMIAKVKTRAAVKDTSGIVLPN